MPKISQDYNPATWMLEVTNVAVEHRTGQDFAALYAASDMYRYILRPAMNSLVDLQSDHDCPALLPLLLGLR